MKVLEVKKAEVKQELKFGDKVKVLAAGGYGDVITGEIGIVVRIDSGDAAPIKVHSENDYDYFNAEQLELVVDDNLTEENPERITGRQYEIISDRAASYSCADDESFWQVGKVLEMTEEHDSSHPRFKAGDGVMKYLPLSYVKLLPNTSETTATVELTAAEIKLIHSALYEKNLMDIKGGYTLYDAISNLKKEAV